MRTITEETTFATRVIFLILPDKLVDRLFGIATPDVTHREIFVASGVTVTITNFLGGSDGQTLKILGDGATTISNNAHLKTNTGSNKLLSANKVYRFTYFKSLSLWVEDA